jgi:hypothetical protein
VVCEVKAAQRHGGAGLGLSRKLPLCDVEQRWMGWGSHQLRRVLQSGDVGRDHAEVLLEVKQHRLHPLEHAIALADVVLEPCEVPALLFPQRQCKGDCTGEGGDACVVESAEAAP